MDQSTVQAFLAALKAGDRTQVRALIAQAPQLGRVRLETGVSAVMLAAYYGQMELAQELAEADVELDLDLFEATILDRRARVRALLTERPTLVNEYSADGFTALGFAAFFGRAEVLELLLGAGAAVNQPSKNQMRVYPLNSAVAHRQPETALTMTRLLLAHGAEANVAQEGGWTPLHQAAAHGQTEIVELLRQAGAIVTVRSDEGRTPADLARDKGHLKLAERLSAPVE